MKNKKFLPTMLSIVLALVCFSISVSGQTTDDKEQIATISGSGSVVRWQVNVPYTSLTLTVVAPDGLVLRKEFKAGATPEITLVDNDGSRLEDGQYNYQLRLTPEISSDVRKTLAAARAKGDGDDAFLAEREMRKRGLLPQALSQSGSFTILRGSVIVGGGVEPDSQRSAGKAAPRKGELVPARSTPSAASPIQDGALMLAAHKVDNDPPLISWKTNLTFPLPNPLPDQVIPDDLIVQGSLCVGFDCVNNESFGFDTIRMKENNTRIKFDDTSTAAGYPANDWQLTANDSASGGQSKFSIEDITGSKVPFTVEAGASTNSIYVDSTGRVGFRTSTPVLDLHVNTSNTPAIRLEQNNSGGFTAQTWDIGANEANFFVRDVTGGSKLSLRIRPGAATSSIDIAANSEVGIMTASPLSTLDVAGNALHIGSESGNNSRTNNTTKLARIAMPPYATANLSFAAIGAATTTTDNVVAIGGGAAGFSAATFVSFITAANNNTDTGSERMRVTSAGNVGIGTTAPSSKLEVNGGDIRVTGGSFIDDGTTLNVPDYVFEDNYPLMSLDELRAYIARKKHLPNMPSAAEVRKNGLNLSQYQMKLLEKIEELTLHVLSEQKLRLEQQKEIEQLKAQIQQLQSRPNRTRGTRARRK